jgi:hypothetical protein
MARDLPFFCLARAAQIRRRQACCATMRRECSVRRRRMSKAAFCANEEQIAAQTLELGALALCRPTPACRVQGSFPPLSLPSVPL